MTVRITSPISSKQKGTPTAMVDNDVKSSTGKVLIKRGTPVQLQVDREKARACGKAGLVTVKCISTTSVDGQYIALEGSTSEEGQEKKGLAIGLGVGLGFFTLIGFACLAIKGGQATIESNTLIPNVFIMNDYNIE